MDSILIFTPLSRFSFARLALKVHLGQRCSIIMTKSSNTFIVNQVKHQEDGSLFKERKVLLVCKSEREKGGALEEEKMAGHVRDYGRKEGKREQQVSMGWKVFSWLSGEGGVVVI